MSYAYINCGEIRNMKAVFVVSKDEFAQVVKHWLAASKIVDDSLHRVNEQDEVLTVSVKYDDLGTLFFASDAVTGLDGDWGTINEDKFEELDADCVQKSRNSLQEVTAHGEGQFTFVFASKVLELGVTLCDETLVVISDELNPPPEVVVSPEPEPAPVVKACAFETQSTEEQISFFQELMGKLNHESQVEVLLGLVKNALNQSLPEPKTESRETPTSNATQVPAEPVPVVSFPITTPPMATCHAPPENGFSGKVLVSQSAPAKPASNDTKSTTIFGNDSKDGVDDVSSGDDDNDPGTSILFADLADDDGDEKADNFVQNVNQQYGLGVTSLMENQE